MSIRKTIDNLIQGAGGVPPVDRSQRTLTDGSTVTDDHREIGPDGLQKGYVVLSENERKRGFIPGIHAALAQSEPALRAYMAMGEQLANSSLTSMERQVVMLDVTRLNGATYCMTGHSAIAQAIGMPADWLAALRAGEPLPDRRIEALRAFVRVLYEHRGEVGEAEWNAFLAAGYTAEQALEVVLAMASKTLSNFASRLGGLPPDVGHGPFVWLQPEQNDDAA